MTRTSAIPVVGTSVCSLSGSRQAIIPRSEAAAHPAVWMCSEDKSLIQPEIMSRFLYSQTTTTRGRTPHARVLVASDWAPIRAFDPIVRHDPESVYGDLLPAPAPRRPAHRQLRVRADVRRRRPSGRAAPCSRASRRTSRGSTAVPFEVACLANNHVLDYGVTGPARDPAAARTDTAIRTVGAGLTDEQAHAPLTLHRQRAARSTSSTSARARTSPRRAAARACSGGTSRGRVAHPAVQEARWRRHRDRALRPGVRAVSAALRRGGVPGDGGRRRRLRDRPPPARAAGHRAMAGTADRLQPRQLRVLPADRPVPPEGRLLRHACSATGDRVSGLELHPYRITDAGLRRLDVKEDAVVPADLARISRPFKTAAGPANAVGGLPGLLRRSRGSRGEVLGILERMKTEPQKGAAMFRNRITTMQHAELWRDVPDADDGRRDRRYSRERPQDRRGVVLQKPSHEAVPFAAGIDDRPDQPPVVLHLAARRPVVQRVELRRPSSCAA